MKNLLLMWTLLFSVNLQAMEEPLRVPNVKVAKTPAEISAEKWQIRKEVVAKRLMAVIGATVVGWGASGAFEARKNVKLNETQVLTWGAQKKRAFSGKIGGALKKVFPAVGIVSGLVAVVAVVIPPIYIKGKPY